MSKTYGMAGWRLGFAVGNSELVRRIETLQDHAFAGIFRPIQEAGIAALTGPQESVEKRRATLPPIATPEWARRGYAHLFSETILQADEGCDFDFLVGCRGAAVPKHSH